MAEIKAYMQQVGQRARAASRAMARAETAAKNAALLAMADLIDTRAAELVGANEADRAAVGELITMKEYVDVIVPRGGKGLIERVSAEARVPVIKHLHGVCHVY